MIEDSRLAFSNISDVLSVENGQLVVKEHAELDRDTLSTMASIEESVNERGYRIEPSKSANAIASRRGLSRRTHGEIGAGRACAQTGVRLLGSTKLGIPRIAPLFGRSKGPVRFDSPVGASCAADFGLA